MDALLAKRSEPLVLEGLEVLDPWFAGLDEPPLTFVLANFCEDRFRVLTLNGNRYVTKLTLNQWEEAVGHAYQFLEGVIDRGWGEDQVRASVESLLTSAGSELRSELWRTVSSKLHFAATAFGDRVLTGVGRGAEQVVEAILTESETPLHYSEIAKRAARVGRPLELRRAHIAAANIGLLFGRGTYGLQKHYPLNEEETDIIINEVENLMEAGPLNRQWHCSELCQILGERGFDFEGRLNAYAINIALMRSPVCAYLGRQVWTLQNGRPLSSAYRIDVHQAVVSLLRQQGRPMTTAEIRSRLLQDRGLGANFQLHPDGSLIRTSTGLWGLIERDVPLSLEERSALMNEIIGALNRLGHGLHVTEIKSAVSSGDLIEKVMDPALICELALQTGRMKVSPGQYIYLSEWEGPRRVGIGEAVKEIMDTTSVEGIEVSQIQKAVSQQIGRAVTLEAVRSALEVRGAVWDQEMGRWRMPREEGEDIGDDDSAPSAIATPNS